ncbi:AAA family ATPase [Cellulosilyticum sp. WCF-2]|uniref:AAA family ATPase n=1 Tax=Cellulosilyticum sp. WCF-2 TaxID=2497860 RepID=UPI000F8E7C52|nr:hypothetical protein [Cellulosilyticum sp. WCF-2]QEH69963.1 hypothetical protein EKH84_16810 [Cellulosilyticum sp. WCF-2]
MEHFGMELRKLLLQGKNKKDAILTFEKGLNVIAGASDTGKSFAYECINYVLGATDIPEIPNEAKKYEWVLLEFIDKSVNQYVTLKRSFLESEKNNIYYCYSNIDHLQTAKIETLSNSSNSKNCLSSKLLGMCNCSYKNILKKSSNGETESFTFRKFVYLVMINETRIVQKNAPIYLGDTKRDKKSTKEAASFFTVLSGLDYQKYIKQESIESKKAHLRGAIEELSLICDELQKQIEDDRGILNECNLQQVVEIISSLEKIIKQQHSIIEDIESQQQRRLIAFNIKLKDRSRIRENLSKFILLKKNYKSDIDRLEFIEQSKDYVGQLIDVRCPVCQTQMKSPVDNNKELYYIAIDKEKAKLKMHLVDLQETIDDLGNELSEINQVIDGEQEKIKSFEREIEQKTKEVSKVLSEHEYYQKIRDRVQIVENNKSKLAQKKKRIQELNEKIDNTKATSNKVDIKRLSEELMIVFCDLIKELLEDWNFIEKITQNTVEFNKKANDIIINGKTKATFGKGARAIINSSFIIAIMQYCIQYNLSHPGFVVLDSPLTTYKEKDRKNNEKNEEVSKSVKKSFFFSMKELSNKCQVIIFDNEIPPDDLEGINYHHFTGNINIERTGFIPN